MFENFDIFSLQRKMNDTSSSPNLLDKDNDDDDPSAEVDEDDDDDDPLAEVDEEEEEEDDDPSATVSEEDESSDEVNIEAIVEKKGRSRFQWSHTADYIVDSGNSKDEALMECCTWLGHEGLAEFSCHSFGNSGQW